MILAFLLLHLLAKALTLSLRFFETRYTKDESKLKYCRSRFRCDCNHVFRTIRLPAVGPPSLVCQASCRGPRPLQVLPLWVELSNRELASREPQGDAARGNRLLQAASPTAMQSGWFFQIPRPVPAPATLRDKKVGSETPGLGRGCEASLKPRRGGGGPGWYQRPLGGGVRARPSPALPDAAATCTACHPPPAAPHHTGKRVAGLRLLALLLRV